MGADFLKTSTGHTAIGATLEAADTMLRAIQNNNPEAGIKLSGGIRTPAQAIPYMKLAEERMQKAINRDWFRIGSSQLLVNILQEHQNDKTAAGFY